MGGVNLNQEVSAKEISPCHMAMETQENTETKTPCSVCENTLHAWEKDTVFSPEKAFEIKTKSPCINTDLNIFSWDFEVPEKYVFAYSPPPEALAKAITPITKTVVLIV